jgi:hypothetical protein
MAVFFDIGAAVSRGGVLFVEVANGLKLVFSSQFSVFSKLRKKV